MIERIRTMFTRRSSQEGATAVEYGLMVALIAVVIIGAVTFLGQKTSSSFCATGEAIANAGASPATVTCP